MFALYEASELRFEFRMYLAVLKRLSTGTLPRLTGFSQTVLDANYRLEAANAAQRCFPLRLMHALLAISSYCVKTTGHI